MVARSSVLPTFTLLNGVRVTSVHSNGQRGEASFNCDTVWVIMVALDDLLAKL